MEFIFDCPHCRRQLAADETARGEAADCPACLESFTVPHAMAVQEEELVEVLEEFRLPARTPPLSHRDPNGPLPPSYQKQPASRPTPTPTPPGASSPARTPRQSAQVRLHRHSYQPLQRRTIVLALSLTIAFCILSAALIAYFGSSPGGGTSASARHPAKVASKNGRKLDLTRLSPAELQEWAVLASQAVQSLSREDGAAVSLIYTKLSRRQSPTTEEWQLFYALVAQKGASGMSPQQRDRLAALFAKCEIPVQ